MLRQAQQLQSKMGKIQEEVSQKTVEATVGGGMVTAVANGKQQLVKLSISQEAIDPDDTEMLEDMVMAAVNKALDDSQEMVKEAMSGLTAGFNIPGLNM
ncbi:MAG: YbaB/EbfC family nucleoid-associated protein [bacterium]